MRGLSHTFYDDGIIVDLRYLVSAEVWDDPEDEGYNIGFLLNIGDSAQRASSTYPTREDRDAAFGRLLALHQTFEAHVHTQEDNE